MDVVRFSVGTLTAIPVRPPSKVDRSVTVTLSAPVELPLHIPGSPAKPVVGASSTAAVTLQEN